MNHAFLHLFPTTPKYSGFEFDCLVFALPLGGIRCCLKMPTLLGSDINAYLICLHHFLGIQMCHRQHLMPPGSGTSVLGDDMVASLPDDNRSCWGQCPVPPRSGPNWERFWTRGFSSGFGLGAIQSTYSNWALPIPKCQAIQNEIQTLESKYCLI